MQQTLKAFLLAVLASMPIAHATLTSQSKDVVVMQPGDLPEVAQIGGQSMELHNSNNGTTYLYLEQQQLSRLAILDVTDPSHIQTIGSVKLATPEVFDFVRPLGDSAVLVCFRDHKGSAVIDFRKPKNPVLSLVSVDLQGTHTEGIGRTSFLMLDGPTANPQRVVRDYRVVDSSDPRMPHLLATVHGVAASVVNGETGTTYLLGQSGLTVVRQPEAEEKHRVESNAGN